MLYNYKKADFDKFHKSLASVPWHLAEVEDIDVWWIHWKDLFTATNDTVPELVGGKGE